MKQAFTLLCLGESGTDLAKLSEELRLGSLIPALKSISRLDHLSSALASPEVKGVLCFEPNPIASAALLLQHVRHAKQNVPVFLLMERYTEAKAAEMLKLGFTDVFPREAPIRLAARWLRATQPEWSAPSSALSSLAGEGEKVSTLGESKLQRAHAALLHLARTRSFFGDNLIEDFFQITELAARSLDVARASVWLFNDDRSKIRCIDVYEPAYDRHGDSEELLYKDHPAYFLALEKQRLVVAHDAMCDPLTFDFANDYLQRHQITSMLDAAVHKRGQWVGVFCLEHVGTPRVWTTEEEVLACCFADLVSLALEASERLMVEQHLHEQELRYNDIYRNTSDIIVTVEVKANGTFVCLDLNPAGERLTGFTSEQLIGKSAAEVIPFEEASYVEDKYQEAVQTGMPVTFELECTLPAGKLNFNVLIVPVRDWQGRIHRLALIARDISAKKKAEEEQRRLQTQLFQAQKLQALGTLAGGLAHDFNNILTGILGHAELLKLDAELSPQQQASLDVIHQATLRAQDLVQRIMTFSCKQPPNRKALDLGKLIPEVLRLMRPSIPVTVAIETRIDPRVPTLQADAGQMQQVLVNLCTNAVQAMGENGGQLRIHLDRFEVREPLSGQLESLREGSYARLTISDTGPGMDVSTLNRVFEPFFTTKPPGVGSGLGLAVVHGIVQNHDGAIAVHSQPGNGASFEVYLPISPTFQPVEEIPQTSVPRGNGEEILFVDDEPMVVNLAVNMLDRLGYKPRPFTNPLQALAVFRAAPQRFGGMVTDLIMPQLSGTDLARQVRLVRGDLPIILTSGFSGAIDSSSAHDLGFESILGKPFTLKTLADALYRAIVKSSKHDLNLGPQVPAK